MVHDYCSALATMGNDETHPIKTGREGGETGGSDSKCFFVVLHVAFSNGLKRCVDVWSAMLTLYFGLYASTSVGCFNSTV